MTTALSATVTDSLKEEVSPIKVNAGALVIASSTDVELARDFIRQIKERRNKVDSTFDFHIKSAHAAHKALVATKKTFTDDLDEAERIVKNKVGQYQLEQERIAAEKREQARKEAEALQQKTMEAAQKKIAATLGKASTVQEKITLLEYSMKHDNLDEVTQGMVERQIEVLNLQLQGLEDKARAAQAQAEAAAEQPAYIPPAAVPEKTSGVSAKKVYNIVSIDASLLIQEIAKGAAPASLVKNWDETALKKFALMGMMFKGVEYQEDRSISIR